MIIKNATLRGKNGKWDIAVENDKILSVLPADNNRY
jgi:hypothetical protein